MATFLERFGRALFDREPAKPTKEQGVPGFRIYGGYLQQDETNQELLGRERWRRATDILANVSVVAASVRFMLNLISRPAWSWDPVDDSAAAREAAEFMQSAIEDMDTSWTRVIRRAGMYRFHGFAAYEWIAKKRDDGRIGIGTIEPRPQHTIEKWDVDDAGKVIGLIQRDPQSSRELYLPRSKLLYLVDDTLTDRPDGMGWFRHLVEPANRLRSLLDLEAIGFERDLRGIPIGRAPFHEMNRLVKEGKLTEQQRDQLINDMDDFVGIQRKTSKTGMVLDSQPYLSTTETGTNPSSVMQWGIELVTGDAGSIEELGDAIKRMQFDMALIMGTEVMLTGREGEGSRALSEDKSRNLYLNANAILWDIAEAVDRDIRDPLWVMNGLPDELKPTASFEDVAFKDAEMIAGVLADMASAGAILAPDDPAINDLRDLLGIEHAEPLDVGMLNALQGRPDPTKPPEEEKPEGSPGGKPPGGKEPAEKVQKSEPAPLYVHRKLKPECARRFIAWAKQQGFRTTMQPDQLHVTIAYSKVPVDWMQMGNAAESVTMPPGGPRKVEPLGDDGAIVLLFRCADLEMRHEELRSKGAVWSHQTYQPHVSITWDGGDIDLSKVQPFTEALEFGPEIFAAIDEDWQSGVTEKGGGSSGRVPFGKGYNPDQPRDPKGTSTGGQWTSAGTGAEWRSDEDSAEIQSALYDEARAHFEDEKEQALALQRYQRQGYNSARSLNAYLRSGAGPDPKLDAAVANLDGAMQANDLSGVELYRGAGQIGDLRLPSSLTEAQALVGQEAIEPGYPSTSIYPSNFVSGSNQMLRIRGAREGALVMAARDSKAIARSVAAGEKLAEGAEVVLPRGTGFRITGVSETMHPTIPDKPLLIYDAEITRTAKAYNPNQPRDPAGTPTGGRWTSNGAGGEEGDPTAEELLRQQTGMFQQLGAPTPKETWLLEQGEQQGPPIDLPSGLEMGTPKECYKNTFHALLEGDVSKSEWAYTEGVVTIPGIPITIDHAWLSNQKGEVLDLTIRDQKGHSYFGVPMKWDFVMQRTMDNEYYGLFSNGVTVDRELVSKPIGENRAWPKTEKRFNPNQPRDPKGTSTGGRWTSVSTYIGDNPYQNSVGINGKLRAGQELTEEEKKVLDDLEAEIEENGRVSEGETVWRGTAGQVHSGGDSSPHPLSTSQDADVALEFAENAMNDAGEQDPVLYQIYVPKGTRVLDTAPYQDEGMRYQKEVMLPRGRLVYRNDKAKTHHDYDRGVTVHRMRLEPAEAAKKRFNPNQPRVPAGQPGGGQWLGDNTDEEDAGEVRPFTPQTREELVAPLASKDLDELLADAAENQRELGRIGADLEGRLGLRFVDPGTKSAARIVEKVQTEGYDGAHQLTDMARASFVVRTPADADRVANALAVDSVVYDKGWRRLRDSGYLDRKLFVQFDNGGVAEVQLVPEGVYQRKGVGHRYYEIVRSPKSSAADIESALEASRQLYGGAVQGTEFEQLGD